jgi:hypothetical protein
MLRVERSCILSDRKPAVVSRNLLAMMLEDMAERVRNGDCFGGGIEFHYWDEENGANQDEYSALGAYRIGNREGQGGMRLIEDGVNLKSMAWVAGSPPNF